MKEDNQKNQENQKNQRYHEAKRVTLIGAAFNLILAIVKVFFGWLGRSHALVADGIHSFSDLLTDLLVIIATRLGSDKADSEHPYGHQRIETASTLFLALLLIIAGLGIGWYAAEHLIFKTIQHPHSYVLAVIICSIFINEFLYHYTLRSGRRVESKLLIANAWHHRSDAASSMIVLLGVLGALMGYVYLDAVAAIVVGLLIIKMGWGLGWSSVRELIDTGVPPEALDQIRAVIQSVPGVITLHQLRTRCMGENILIDAHVLVGPKLSVSEGHFIAANVHRVLEAKISNISDVTIHIDPENDEVVAPSVDLPPRQEVMAQLMAHWLICPGVAYLHDTSLHYLDGKIHVDLSLPLMVLDEGVSASEVRERYREVVESIPYIASVDIYFF